MCKMSKFVDAKAGLEFDGKGRGDLVAMRGWGEDVHFVDYFRCHSGWMADGCWREI